jgi:DNA-binding LacI/PurR family transcriptional regulator
MSRSNITIQEIAQALKVSTATVSRALNDKPGVGKGLKSKVVRYAKDRGYVPNRNAVSIRVGNSSIALFIIRTQGIAGTSILSADAFEMTNRLGLEPHVVRIPYGEDFTEGLHRAEIAYNPAIFIFYGPCEIADSSQLEALKAPILFILSDDAPAGYPQIVSDDRHGARAITESLIGAGHESIMVLTERKPDGSAYYHDRIEGLKDALAAHGLGFDTSALMALPIDYGDYIDSAMTTIRAHAIPALTSSRHRPSAILALSDYLAFALAKVLADEGIRVPSDVSLASFGGWSITALMPVSIQSWVQPAPDIIQTAAQATSYLLGGRAFAGTIPLTDSWRYAVVDEAGGVGARGAGDAADSADETEGTGRTGETSETGQVSRPAEARAISSTCFMVPGYLRLGQSVRRFNGPTRIDLRRTNQPMSAAPSTSLASSAPLTATLLPYPASPLTR